MSTRKPGPTPKPVRTIVIDDSRTTRFILTNALRRAGNFVVIGEASDGEEALALLRHTPDVELAMVDWNMPTMTGIDFVRAVRGNPALNALKIVMVTSEGDLEHITEALRCGANEYVMKPFTDEDIATKLFVLGFTTRR